ncbi:MAG: tetratricopeptide repeat protein [Syntrophales bacterium]
MSLITDLLSGVRQGDHKRDIPPILRDSVLEETARRKARKRFLIPVVALCGIFLGSGAVFFFPWKSLLPPPNLSRVTQQTTPEVKRIPHVAVPLPTQSLSQVPQPAKSPHGSQDVDTAVEQKPKSEPVRHTREKLVARSSKQDAISVSTGALKERGRKKEPGMGSGLKTTGESERNISKQDRDLYLYMARTFETEKDYQRSLSNYKKVLDIEPDNYLVINNISCALIHLGLYEEAIDYAKRAYSLRRDYTPSLINLGAAYGQLGNYRESEGYLLKALSMEPKNQVILLNLGLIYEKMDDLDKAGKYFIILSETGKIEGYMGLARIAEEQGRTADAVNFYKMAMSVDSAGSQTWDFVNERLLQLTR